MASTIIAGIGIIVSVSLGLASLQNNYRDRLSKIRPDLLFNIGGQEVPAILQPVTSIPGLNQRDDDVVNFIKALPADIKAPSLQGQFGQLYNLGAGTAYDIYIWFEPDRITTGGNERRLTRAEQGTPPYTKEWNSIAATPANLALGSAASFGILPASVYVAGPHVNAISGDIRIECRDLNGRPIQPGYF
jgi:hypothetical protein